MPTSELTETIRVIQILVTHCQMDGRDDTTTSNGGEALPTVRLSTSSPHGQSFIDSLYSFNYNLFVNSDSFLINLKFLSSGNSSSSLDKFRLLQVSKSNKVS